MVKRRVLSDEGFPEAVSQGPFSYVMTASRLFSLVDLKIFKQIRNRLRPMCLARIAG